MSYSDPAAQRKAVAESTRRYRLFKDAVRAGQPKAIEAERQRVIAVNPMKPERELYDCIAALPTREERQARKAEYLALRERCLSGVDAKAALATYKRLRAEVVAEMEAAAAAGCRPPAPSQ
jgi:hypothetical protein